MRDELVLQRETEDDLVEQRGSATTFGSCRRAFRLEDDFPVFDQEED